MKQSGILGGVGGDYLVEPGALQDEHAATEELHNHVVSHEHLQHGAGRPAEHGHQQQGVNVSVQRRAAVHVVIEQEPWGRQGTARVREGHLQGEEEPHSRVTFHKESHGEGEAVHAGRHQSGRGAGEQHDSVDPEEQVHGAVLPVHQLHPGVVLSVVEVGVRPAHHKLFDHYPCGGGGQLRSDQERWRRGGVRGKLTDKGGEDRHAALAVVHSFKEKRHRGPTFGPVSPPVVMEDVFDRQPEAQQQEKPPRDGMSSEVGHGQAWNS